MNMSRVSVEATAAVKHSQSPDSLSQYSLYSKKASCRLTLGVGVTSIQRNTILIGDSRVEVTLHLVDILRHQVQTKLSIGEQIVKKTCQILAET